MDLKIENDIPLPTEVGVRGNITSTLRKLEPGQSVFIPNRKAVQMSGFVSNAGLSGKLTMRSEDGGVRIWRKQE